MALTEAGLARGLLWNKEIPIPSIAPYRDHTVIVGKSDGSNQEYGFRNITFSWDRLTALQGFYIRKIVNAARIGTGILYLTIDRDDATRPGYDWIDVSGRPGRLVLTKSGPRQRSGIDTFDNVTLTVNNLTIVNSPSNYST